MFATRIDDWLSCQIDHAALDDKVRWKTLPGGARIGKLHREGDTGLVLYHVPADAGEEAFQPHTHTGGEMYLVLKGEVADDAGTYPEGSLVWMPPGSRHRPTTQGETLILVLWPEGVKG